MHNRLIKSQDIQMHSFGINPPLGKERLQALCGDIRLTPELEAFYLEMNGCQLSYTFVSNADFNKKEFGYYDNTFPVMWPNNNYWNLDGCINILPLDFLMLNDWTAYTSFDLPDAIKINYKGIDMARNHFEKNLKPLDVFSKDVIAVVYFHQNDCDIVLGTDHNASYTDFLPMDFDEYFNNIIISEGLVDGREKFFKPSRVK